MKKYNHFKNRPIEDQDSEGTAVIWSILLSFGVLAIFMTLASILLVMIS